MVVKKKYQYLITKTPCVKHALAQRCIRLYHRCGDCLVVILFYISLGGRKIFYFFVICNMRYSFW